MVVVNTENTASSLTQRQLIDLYMGRNLYFPDGQLALRLDQAPDSAVRHQFYQRLVGKTVAQVNAYWARLLFTGRASPPQVIQHSKDILKTVRNNHHAIGYMDENDVDDSVRIISRVN